MDVTLNQLTDLAQRQIDQEKNIKDFEASVKQEKEALGKTMMDIADMMSEIGVEKIKLENGKTVSIKPNYYPKIKDEDVFFDWLRDNNYGDIIKNKMDLLFDKKEDPQALTLMTYLKDAGYKFSYKSSVHAMTLKSFCKEMLEEGAGLPDSIEVTNVKKSYIKG